MGTGWPKEGESEADCGDPVTVSLDQRLSRAASSRVEMDGPPLNTQPPGTGTVAIVEDDDTVRESVAFSLRREGFEVLEFADGLAAWESLEADAVGSWADVVVLDVMMPRMDGLELCRRLRARSESLPILFLTSRDEEFDRVLGLELGADDYLCKPFSMRELIARIRVLFRRLQLIELAGQGEAGEADDLIEAGDLTLDLGRHQAAWKSQRLRLTITEFQLVRALAKRPGQVKSRADLMQEAYPHDAYKSDRTIDTHIKRVRKKLADLDPSFQSIETVYGLGYRWREREGFS